MPTRRASHQSRLVGVDRNTGTPDTTLEQWKRFAAAATPVANRALGAPPTAGSYQRRHFHTLNRLQLSVRTHQLSPAAQANARCRTAPTIEGSWLRKDLIPRCWSSEERGPRFAWALHVETLVFTPAN